MKFLIAAGHEGTTGAVSGKLIEEVLTEQLSEKIVKILKEQGHEATEPNFNLYDEVSKATWPTYVAGFDYVLEVHFNQTAGANGTEIYVAEGITKIGVEKAIMQRLGKWFKLRDPDGVKTGTFKTIKRLGNKGALLEVAFIDSKSDMATYLSNVDKIAQDIAYGILDGFGVPIKDLTPKQEPVKPAEDLAPDGKLFQVAIGAYTFRKNAEEEMAKAKAAGLSPYIALIDIP